MDRGARTRTGEGDEREWVYDPRREARRQLARVPLPDDVDPRELDYDVRKQLMTLAKDTADLVARHLVVAGRLMDDEPVQALAHARAARALAGRVGAVREANGLVAYLAGEWQEALSELRTARRLTGDPEHLPVMADCERALGRPDRALLVAEDPQAKGLSPAARVELLIVSSGARRDQGQAAAAVVSLQVAALEGPVRAWTARLRYAYADALLECGREDEAREWFARAAEVDERGETDADERVLELDGVVFQDLDEGADDEGADDEGAVAEVLAAADVAVPVLHGAVTAEDTSDVHGEDHGSAGVDAPTDVEPARLAATAPRIPPAGFREVPDAEIPALGKAGSTGLGFVAPEGTTEDTDPDELRLFD